MIKFKETIITIEEKSRGAWAATCVLGRPQHTRCAWAAT